MKGLKITEAKKIPSNKSEKIATSKEGQLNPRLTKPKSYVRVVTTPCELEN